MKNPLKSFPTCVNTTEMRHPDLVKKLCPMSHLPLSAAANNVDCGTLERAEFKRMSSLRVALTSVSADGESVIHVAG